MRSRYNHLHVEPTCHIYSEADAPMLAAVAPTAAAAVAAASVDAAGSADTDDSAVATAAGAAPAAVTAFVATVEVEENGTADVASGASDVGSAEKSKRKPVGGTVSAPSGFVRADAAVSLLLAGGGGPALILARAVKCNK
jgi:hypothetical protein